MSLGLEPERDLRAIIGGGTSFVCWSFANNLGEGIFQQ